MTAVNKVAIAAFGALLIVVFNSFRLVRSGEELEPHLAPTPTEPPHGHKHDAGGAQPIGFKARTV